MSTRVVVTGAAGMIGSNIVAALNAEGRSDIIVVDDLTDGQKFRNLAHNDKVAFVVDDIASRDPWRVRCLEIRGTAEQAVTASGQVAPAGDVLDSAIIRITPRRIISFGIDDTDTEPHLLKADSRNV